MDKYRGINKVEAEATPITYNIKYRNKKKSNSEGHNHSRIWNFLRYGICIFALLVCFAGKYTSYQPAQTASGYIKEELSRDITKELDILKDSVEEE